MPIVVPSTPIVIPPGSTGMELEEGLFALLAGDTNVAAIFGQRIYPNRLPQPPDVDDAGNLATSLVYTRIGGGVGYAHDGPLGTKEARFWIDIYAVTHQAVRGGREAVEALLSGFRGNPPDSPLEIQGIFFEAMREAFEPDPLERQYRSNIEFVINYLEH